MVSESRIVRLDKVSYLCTVMLFRIIPSFFVDKASCTRQFESELSLHSLASLFPIKEGIFSNPSVSLSKGSSTFLTKPLFPQGREDVTALRCSEPLRSKVGGPSKVFAMLCGMGPPDCYGDQRLRPLPNNSECEPKRTNSIALLFLSNQIKSVSFSIWHSI